MAWVEKRPAGTRSQSFVVRWRDASGAVSQKSFREPLGSERSKAAEQFAALKGRDAQLGDLVDERSARQTFREVAERWLAAKQAKGRKVRTTEEYRRILDSRVLPRFGDERIRAVSSLDLDEWVVELASKLAPATVRRIYGVASSVFKYAVNHRIVRNDPCGPIELPSVPRFAANFLTREEVALLIDKMDIADPNGFIVRLPANTGLRVAEASGLRIQDVSMFRRETAEIRVRQTLTMRGAGEDRWRLDTPKSARSRREIPITDDALFCALRDYLDRHPCRDDPAALLLCGREVGGIRGLDWSKPWEPGTFLKRSYRFGLKAAKLPPAVRLHDLRHTAISWWLADGHDMWDVSHWAGHASMTTTDQVYGHFLPKTHTAAIDRARAARERDASLGAVRTRLRV